MNLDPILPHLTAEMLARKSNESYYNQAKKLQNECLDHLENGEMHFALNCDDIPREITQAVKKNLEDAGYKVEVSMGIFIVDNPYAK